MDYNTILSLNRPEYTYISKEIRDFFNEIGEPYRLAIQASQRKDATYTNNYNTFFYGHTVRKKVTASNDPELLKQLRVCLSKLTESNYVKIEEKIFSIINNIELDSWINVAELVHTNMIDNIFLIDIYIKLLISLKKEYDELVKEINCLLYKQVLKPAVYTKNTISETGVDKTKRWKISNAMIITNLYLDKKYSNKFFNKIVDKWLSKISYKNQENLEIFVKILPLIETTDLDKHIIDKIKRMKQDKEYTGRIRFLLEFKSEKGKK